MRTHPGSGGGRGQQSNSCYLILGPLCRGGGRDWENKVHLHLAVCTSTPLPPAPWQKPLDPSCPAHHHAAAAAPSRQPAQPLIKRQQSVPASRCQLGVAGLCFSLWWLNDVRDSASSTLGSGSFPSRVRHAQPQPPATAEAQLRGESGINT